MEDSLESSTSTSKVNRQNKYGKHFKKNDRITIVLGHRKKCTQ